MATKNEKSVFETLYAVNVNDKTEKKNGLTYLSWPYAWAEVKKYYPEAKYKVYENESGWNYFTDGRTCWVKTSVTIGEQEHIEYLPVMDFRNNSIPADKVTSVDVNKSIQRSLTKCCARHGLGLYIYAGEDIPEADKMQPQPQPQQNAVSVDDIKRWLAAVTNREQLEKAWKAVPTSQRDTVKEMFTQKGQELKGGAK